MKNIIKQLSSLKNLVIMLASALLLTGCTFHVNVQPDKTAPATEEATESAGKDLTAGVYYEEINEEFDGEDYHFIYYLILNEDGTGGWSSQDYIDVEWTANTVTDAYDTYSAELVGDDLKIYGNGVVYEFKKFNGKLVQPEKYDISEDDIPDGTYPVNISSVEKDGDELLATIDLFTEDWYDIVDIGQLEKGDAIIVNFAFYIIDTIERVDNRVVINGGLENGGTELINPEDTNGYRYFGFDDMSSYFMHFETRLPISKDAVLEDSYGTPGEVTEYKYKDLEKCFNEENYFFVNNTRICLEKGKITNIIRIYTP